METFKEFLEKKCIEETHCIKDNFQEHWEEWEPLEDLDEVSKYAEEWKRQELKKWVELADTAIEELQKIKNLIK